MFSSITAIDSIHMFDEKDPNTPLKKITSPLMKNAISLTFEYASRRIFYSDIQKGSINTVFFNGSGHSVLIDSEWKIDDQGVDGALQTLCSNLKLNTFHLKGIA